MAKHGKKYTIAAEKVDSTKSYPIGEALSTVLDGCYSKFDESIPPEYVLTLA